MRYDAFHPGQTWLDTEGKRIQAQGGSVMYVDGVYYWYGENKEKTDPEKNIWHWGGDVMHPQICTTGKIKGLSSHQNQRIWNLCFIHLPVWTDHISSIINEPGNMYAG